MENKVNIVYLLDSLKIGGVQQGSLLQVANLNKDKYATQVWSLRAGKENSALADEFKKQNIPVVYVPVKHYNDSTNILALAKKLKEEKIGLLNTKSFYPNIVGRIAAYAANVPLVIANFHSTYQHQWEEKYIIYERMLREITDTFICVSKSVKTHLQPLLALPEERIKIIYNGIDVKRYTIPIEKNVLREKLKFPKNLPIIGMIGRLSKVKEIPILLDAVPFILKEFPKSLFVLVGDGKERGYLEKLVESKNLKKSVCFLGSRSDVPEILNAIDCVVLPSLVEGFPRVLLEAFASKTPIIATPAGGVPEILRDGINGLLIPFSNPAQLAQAVNKTLFYPDEAKKRSEEAFKNIQKFSLENWVAEIEDIFDSAIARRKEEIFRYQNDTNTLSLASLYFRFFKFRTIFRVNKMMYKIKNE